MEYMMKASAIVVLMLLSITDCKKDEVFIDPELDPILEAMAPVCFGQGILAAASFNGYPIHKIVLLNSDGSKSKWSYQLSKSWMPTCVEETQLVVCLGKQHKGTLSTCSYSMIPYGPTTNYLERVGWMIKVDLREARSGLIISSTELSTPLPECPKTVKFNQTTLVDEYDHKIELSALEKWLNPFVNQK
jgi:hypothetical protein